MPNPSPSDVQVDKLLSGQSVAYVQSDQNFAGRLAAPIVGVNERSGLIAKYDKGDFLRNQVRKRAPGDAAAEGGYRTDNSTQYFCDVFALSKKIDPQTRANEQNPYDSERDATRFLSQQALINWEQLFADACMTTGVWTGQADQAGGSEFTRWDQSGSTPISDLRGAISAVGKSTGKRPNGLVMGEDAWNILADHADLIDRIKHTSPDAVTIDLLARLLELDPRYVRCSRAVKNTANEGATASMSYIASDSALVLCVEDNPSEMMPSAAETFAWTRYTGAAEGGGEISTWFERKTKSTIVEIEQALDVKVIASDMGAYFSDIKT